MSTITYESTKVSSNIVCLTIQCVANMIRRTALKLKRFMFCKGRGDPLQGYHIIFLILVILGLMNIAFWIGFATANLKNRFANMKNRLNERRVDLQSDGAKVWNLNSRLSGKFSREMKFDTVKDNLEADEDIAGKVGNEENELDRLKKLKEEAQKKIEDEDLQKSENKQQGNDVEKKVAELNRIEENLKKYEGNEEKAQSDDAELIKIDLRKEVEKIKVNEDLEQRRNDEAKRKIKENHDQNHENEDKYKSLKGQKENQKPTSKVQQKENAFQFTLHSDEVLKQMPLVSMEDLEENRTAVVVVVFVFSSPNSFDRRQAIRETWWTKCRQPQAACYFVTDGFIKESMYYKLINEHNKYNDMLFLPTDEGLNFGLRLFFLLQWAESKYKPSFFLRVDADYFLCIERLLNELPQRRQKALVWGHWHCRTSAVFADESFLLLSFDLVEMILSWDEEKLLCHPYGDQELALWLTQHSVQFFGFHDKRLSFNPSTSDFDLLKNSTTKFCDVRLGVREIYPTEMKTFWSNGNDGKKAVTDLEPVYPNVCRYRPNLKWESVQKRHRFKPELCVKNPRWTGKEVDL